MCASPLCLTYIITLQPESRLSFYRKKKNERYENHSVRNAEMLLMVYFVIVVFSFEILPSEQRLRSFIVSDFASSSVGKSLMEKT